MIKHKDNFEFCRIAPHLKYLVYYIGVMRGGEAEWDFVFEQFKSANVSDKSALHYALAGSQEPWLIER